MKSCNKSQLQYKGDNRGLKFTQGLGGLGIGPKNSRFDKNGVEMLAVEYIHPSDSSMDISFCSAFSKLCSP